MKLLKESEQRTETTFTLQHDVKCAPRFCCLFFNWNCHCFGFFHPHLLRRLLAQDDFSGKKLTCRSHTSSVWADGSCSLIIIRQKAKSKLQHKELITKALSPAHCFLVIFRLFIVLPLTSPHPEQQSFQCGAA
jgi:hypothetical protein